VKRKVWLKFGLFSLVGFGRLRYRSVRSDGFSCKATLPSLASSGGQVLFWRQT